MAKVPSRGLDRRHQEGAPRRRRGPQARHPGRRDPRHQLRPRRGRLPDPGQRRRDPLGHPADPRRRRRRGRGPAWPARAEATPSAEPAPAATSRWPSGSASCSRRQAAAVPRRRGAADEATGASSEAGRGRRTEETVATEPRSPPRRRAPRPPRRDAPEPPSGHGRDDRGREPAAAGAGHRGRPSRRPGRRGR